METTGRELEEGDLAKVKTVCNEFARYHEHAKESLSGE
jgi:hypothetical protein